MKTAKNRVHFSLWLCHWHRTKLNPTLCFLYTSKFFTSFGSLPIVFSFSCYVSYCFDCEVGNVVVMSFLRWKYVFGSGGLWETVSLSLTQVNCIFHFGAGSWLLFFFGPQHCVCVDNAYHLIFQNLVSKAVWILECNLIFFWLGVK